MKTATTKNLNYIFLAIALFLLFLQLANAQNGVGINTITPKSNFEVNGSFGQTVTTVTSNTTLDTNQSLVICNNGAVAISITLPAVVSCDGRIYNIKKDASSTAAVTISGTIDGVSNLILKNTGEGVTIFSNGTEWKTMNNYNSSSNWLTSGNTGTTAGTNYIGTSDATDFVVKTNAVSRVNVSSTGVTTIGGVTDHIKIEADGTIVMEGAATVWDDIRVTMDKGSNSAALGFFPGAASGPEIWFFRNNSAVEAMSFTVQLPHTWKEGSTIYPHLHWIPKTTGTGNVEWNFEYSWANYDAVTPQVFPAISTSTVVATGGFTQGIHTITPLTTANVGLDATGKKVSSFLICRIWRDSSRGADTYNWDTGVLSLDFHYEMNTFGSHTEIVK